MGRSRTSGQAVRAVSGLLVALVVWSGPLGLRAGAATRPGTEHSRTIVVTWADEGHSYRLHRGDVLEVELSSPASISWSEPVSSDQAVLERTGGSSGVSASATFDAIAKGEALVSATGSPVCSQVCPTLLLAFEVSVSVR